MCLPEHETGVLYNPVFATGETEKNFSNVGICTAQMQKYQDFEKLHRVPRSKHRVTQVSPLACPGRHYSTDAKWELFSHQIS